MKVILDLALSSDGFIATIDGDSDWVSERTEDLFKKRIRACGSLVVGNKTFKQYATIYPVKGVLNIVMSKKKHVSKKEVFYARSSDEVLKIATGHHCSGIIVAGGAAISKLFLENGLIDEIYFSIHPIQLRKGIKPFGDLEMPKNLKLLNTLDLGDGIKQRHYLVKK